MLYIIIWIICGVIAGYMYQQRGRSQGVGFLAGFLLGPIGIVLALLTSSELIKCPHCAERIQPDAKICRFCGQEIPVELQREPSKTNWSGPLIFGFIILVLILVFVLGPFLKYLFRIQTQEASHPVKYLPTDKLHYVQHETA